MTREDLMRFREWFSRYCASFYTADPEHQRNISLKEEHTHCVCDNMRRITEGLSRGEDLQLLAETVALFHDVGRFPQYQRYRTFLDSVSINHGLLGWTVLTEQAVLRSLPEREAGLVLDAVKFHNAYALPHLDHPDGVFLLRLIRDADKLDIWRVFIECYESPSEQRASAVTLGFPDEEGYSQEILSHVRHGKVAPLARVRTLNDFKLLQLSWVHDLNFPPTLKLLSDREYISRIASVLPPADEIGETVALLKETLQEKLRG
jgi:hypothetical protein